MPNQEPAKAGPDKALRREKAGDLLMILLPTRELNQVPCKASSGKCFPEREKQEWESFPFQIGTGPQQTGPARSLPPGRT